MQQKRRSTQSSLERSVVTYARDSHKEKNLCLFKQPPIPAKVTFYTISRAFVSCLGCQHFISDWLGKLKPNKLSTRCQNELKGAAVEKATNPGRRFLFFSRLRRSFSRASREFRGYAAPAPGSTKPPCYAGYLTACSGISAPDIPSDWSIVTVNIITW